MQWFELSSNAASAANTRGSSGHTFFTSVCSAKLCPTIWLYRHGKPQTARMAYPLGMTGPQPSDDMPESARELYEEARGVAGRSPRAAAALLRMCTEDVVRDVTSHLPPKTTLNNRIKHLVKEAGLRRGVQQALDSLRVFGNDAAHSAIRIDENLAIATALFQLVNVIVVSIITERNIIQDVYGALPESARAAIETRDS